MPLPRHHDLEVLARDAEPGTATSARATEQLDQRGVERLLPRRVERARTPCGSARSRSGRPRSSAPASGSGRRTSCARCGCRGRAGRTARRAGVSVPHAIGEREPGRRRHEPPDQLEELADEALGRPVGEPDPAARAHDAQQLGRGALLVRREHHAEGREHDVERRVGERELLGVGDLEGDRQPVGLGAPPCPARAARARSRSRSRRRSGGPRRARRCRCRRRRRGRGRRRAGRPPRTATRRRSAADADPAEVARGPGRLLAGLDRLEVEGGTPGRS